MGWPAKYADQVLAVKMANNNEPEFCGPPVTAADYSVLFGCLNTPRDEQGDGTSQGAHALLCELEGMALEFYYDYEDQSAAILHASRIQGRLCDLFTTLPLGEAQHARVWLEVHAGKTATNDVASGCCALVCPAGSAEPGDKAAAPVPRALDVAGLPGELKHPSAAMPENYAQMLRHARRRRNPEPPYSDHQEVRRRLERLENEADSDCANMRVHNNVVARITRDVRELCAVLEGLSAEDAARADADVLFLAGGRFVDDWAHPLKRPDWMVEANRANRANQR